MTPQQIEAMNLALEALKWCHGGEPCGTSEAITAIEEVLAQPEQEPVAWDNCRSEKQCRSWCGNSTCVSHWSYTTPPQRKPLHASEIVTMYAERPTSDNDMIEFARAIEAAHDIKENT